MATILITGGGRGLGRATAEALALMAGDPSIEGVGGQFLGECHPIASSPESHDAGRARRFWELVAGLTGFDPLPEPGTGT